VGHEHGLNPGHIKALMSLDPSEHLPMGRLAETWRCDASNVTFMVDRLEERGYVRRETSSTDRRVKTVVLTPAGEAARAEMLDTLTSPPPQLLKLSAAELQQLVQVLEKLDMGTVDPAGFWARP
jgi:DNA-binding MarR family transcriptional regulator